MAMTASSTLPRVPRLRSLFDSPAMIRNPVDVFEQYRADYGPNFVVHFGGAKKIVILSDPACIEHVLRDHDRYHKAYIQVERMAEFQGQGLLNSHGDDWLRQRRHLGVGFQHRRLVGLLPMQHDTLQSMMVEFDRLAGEGPVEVYGQMVRFTLSLVGRSLFGHDLSDETLATIGQTITEIQGFIVRQIVHPYKIPWFRLTGQSAHYQRLRVNADQLIRDHIAARTPDLGQDLLGMMLDTPYRDTGEMMTEEQALVESLQLMVAGNETSSVALTWTLYLLAKHPEYIGQLREEIHRVIGTGAPDLGQLHQLDLMMRVVDETMRLYPSFWMFDRLAREDDVIEGIDVSAGTMLGIYIYGAHRNPTVWDDPERFDPARFDRAAKKSRPAYSHIPFGGGPRKCIGANMAVVQILLVLVEVIRRYDFELATTGEVGIKPMFILRPEGPIHLRFHPVTEGGM